MVQEHGYGCVRIPGGRYALVHEWDTDTGAVVNIMDTIMFEAQRQGRLSFYMVWSFLHNRDRTDVLIDG